MPPVRNADFGVTFGDPLNPDIQLITGEAWSVYAEDVATLAPANIGSLTLDPSTPTDNFEVSIANGKQPGAVNVGSIDMAAAGWTGRSSLSGGRIDGNLSGGLTLREDSSLKGGTANGFTIGGDVSGVIDVYDGNGFTIEGNYGGATFILMDHGAGFTIDGAFGDNGGVNIGLFVTDIANGDLTLGSMAGSHVTLGTLLNGRLQVAGDATGSIRVEAIQGSSSVRMGYGVSPGPANIETGFTFASTLPKGAMIDLSNARVSGGIVFLISGYFRVFPGTVTYFWPYNNRNNLRRADEVDADAACKLRRVHSCAQGNHWRWGSERYHHRGRL